MKAPQHKGVTHIGMFGENAFFELESGHNGRGHDLVEEDLRWGVKMGTFIKQK